MEPQNKQSRIESDFYRAVRRVANKRFSGVVLEHVGIVRCDDCGAPAMLDGEHVVCLRLELKREAAEAAMSIALERGE